MVRDHGWKNDYANDVATNYHRFMGLRSKDSNLSPSDDIDKFWHQHILNTLSYTQYCTKNFGKYIHHNPEDAYDQNSRYQRLCNTVREYIKIYGDVNPQIWYPYKKTEHVYDGDSMIIRLVLISSEHNGTKYADKFVEWKDNKFHNKLFKIRRSSNENIKDIIKNIVGTKFIDINITSSPSKVSSEYYKNCNAVAIIEMNPLGFC